MKKLLLTFISVLSFAYAGAQTQAVYSRPSIRCMGVELDGSQTLRVQGYGRNRSDAKEQAKKNAVWAVVFDGIHDGVEGCDMRPLVTEANAREKHDSFFNQFFADNGQYINYVSLKDTKKKSSGKSKDKLGYAYDLTIRVLRPQLKECLKTNGIIK